MTYIADRDPHLEIARDVVSGHRIMRGLGERDDVEMLNQTDIWRGNQLSSTPSSPGSDVTIPFPADAGEQMTIVSEDAQDSPAGTGVRTLALHYLDANGDERVETIEMNGTVEVDTVATDIRFVQDLQTVSAGSNGAAEGNIRIFRETDDTRVYSMIFKGDNQSLVPLKMVPSGKTLILRRWVASESPGPGTTKPSRLRLSADCNDAVPPVRQAGVFLSKSVMALKGGATTLDLAHQIPALSVVKVSAVSEAASSAVAVHWWGVLVDD